MFSASVSACFELENRPDLAYFTRTVNDWFDTLDSRRAKCSNNRLKSGFGLEENIRVQTEALHRMLVLMESMEVGTKLLDPASAITAPVPASPVTVPSLIPGPGPSCLTPDSAVSDARPGPTTIPLSPVMSPRVAENTGIEEGYDKCLDVDQGDDQFSELWLTSEDEEMIFNIEGKAEAMDEPDDETENKIEPESGKLSAMEVNFAMISSRLPALSVDQLRARLLLSRLVPGLEGSAVLTGPEQTLEVVNEEDKFNEHVLTSEDEEMVFNAPHIVPRCL